MDPTVVVAAIASIGSLVGVIYSNRTAVRGARAALASAKETARTQVDAEAFERARASYDAAIAEQERRIARLRAEMQEDREEHRREMESCNQRLESLQRQVAALREWSRPLLRAARAAGVAHPDPPIWLGGGETTPGMPPDPPP